jgi:hypothetical protein
LSPQPSPATQRFSKPLAVGKKREERVHLALIYSRRVKNPRLREVATQDSSPRKDRMLLADKGSKRAVITAIFKGQCHENKKRFFIKHFLLVSTDMPRNDFKFLRIFSGLFDDSGDSPV